VEGWEGAVWAFDYRLRVQYEGGRTEEIDDAYRYGPVLTDFDLHLLAEGTQHRAQEKLGAHLATMGTTAGVHFAVWAPSAERVSVIGDFNGWDGRVNPMRVLVPHLPEPDLGTPMLGTSVLPFGVGLLVLLAAIVTFTRTGGAILLTVASAVSHDLYGKLLKPDATDRAKVVAGRLAVVLFSAIPVALAFRQLALVNFIVIYAAKLMVSFLFVPVVIGLNWRGATRAGALASMLGGLATCVIWTLAGHPYLAGLDSAEAGTLVSAALFFAVSLSTRPVEDERLRVFFPA